MLPILRLTQMNKYLKTAILLLVFSQVFAQNVGLKPQELFVQSKRWILTNNKIEKNEIYLTAYKTTKLKANTFVLKFVSGGKIEYDYETNLNFKSASQIEFLDLNTDESAWAFDSLTNQVLLTIKGGYSSLEDFKFKRSYAIERTAEGFILRKTGEEFYEDLKQKARLEKAQLAQLKKNEAIANAQTKQAITEKRKAVSPPQKIDTVLLNTHAVQATVVSKKALDSLQVTDNKAVASVVSNPITIVNVEDKIIPIPIVEIDYVARSRDLLDKSKRWMLVKNKIERNDIFLTTYDEAKLTINNLIMSFDTDGKIAYDYESDPKIKFCAGVDFLDIDTDETSWEYNAEKNIVTLTLKGGYASLDDFKFKRDYWVETIEDGYILRRLKEHYFTDFRKPAKKEKKLSHK
jgi:hypothetical protein